MPFYMYRGTYTKEAVKALVSHPQDRSRAVGAAIEAHGGKLTGFWMAFGEDDFVAICEMPDDESMAGVALAVSAAGALVRGKTVKLLTMEQAVVAMNKANAAISAYKPPE